MRIQLELISSHESGQRPAALQEPDPQCCNKLKHAPGRAFQPGVADVLHALGRAFISSLGDCKTGEPEPVRILGAADSGLDAKQCEERRPVDLVKDLKAPGPES